MGFNEREPSYAISIVARMVGIHAQTLRYYERVGLIVPSRTQGNQRLYSYHEVQKLQQIQRLVSDLGVNLAGVEVILRLRERLEEIEAERQRLDAEVQRLQALVDGNRKRSQKTTREE
jgi:MerR family transcriptional regulator/heat shock protein HspR